MLHEETHHDFEKDQIIIFDDFDKRIHNLREIINFSEYWAPIGESTQNSNKFIEIVSTFDWEPLI